MKISGRVFSHTGHPIGVTADPASCIARSELTGWAPNALIHAADVDSAPSTGLSKMVVSSTMKSAYSPVRRGSGAVRESVPKASLAPPRCERQKEALIESTCTGCRFGVLPTASSPMPQSEPQPCSIGSSEYWNEVVQRPDGFCLAAIGVRWPDNSRTAVEGSIDDHFDLNDLKVGDATASDCSTARATSTRSSSRLLAPTLTTTVYSMV